MGKLHDLELARPWSDALYQLERRKNKRPICDLISTSKLPEMARIYLVDLIERRFPPLSRGRPKTPAYTVSDKQDAQEAALVDVYLFRRAGMKLDEALRKAANENGLKVKTVERLRKGHHRSFREYLKPSLKQKHLKKPR
jgi:hypothetical protein